LTFTAVAIILTYNIGLCLHIYKETVSVEHHEKFITKKETEFCLGLSTTWLSKYFCFFSSYRSGITRMFERPKFNILCIGLVLIEAVVGKKETKGGFVIIIFAFLTLTAAASRPYRSFHTNIVYIGLNLLMTMISIEMNMKVSGMKSTLFVDKYFFFMQLLQSAFVWSLLLCYFCFMCITK